MTYVVVNPENGQILSASNKNVFGESGIDVGMDLETSELLDNRFIQNGVLSVRPELLIEDNLTFTDEVRIDLGYGTKVLCFDKDFIDKGEGAIITVPEGIVEFQAVIVPPFPYKPKMVSIRIEETDNE
jgi:hypothetical protein